MKKSLYEQPKLFIMAIEENIVTSSAEERAEWGLDHFAEDDWIFS